MVDDCEQALLRSAFYRALALGFSPPDDEVRQKLGSAEGLWRFRKIVEAVGLEADGDFDADADRLAERYEHLFGHTARGQVSPYQTEYGSGGGVLSQPRELADLGAFLAAFGLVLDAACHDRADHVRSECELMAFLSRKEAHALDIDDTRMLEAARQGQRLFLREYLGQFAPAFGTQLERIDRGGFYGALGHVLKRWVEAECTRLNVPVGPQYLPLRPNDVDKVPMACGGCELGGDLG